MSENTGKEVTVQGNIVGFVKTSNAAVLSFQKKCNETLYNLFNDEALVKKFISSVMMCIAQNPKINDCTSASLQNVLLKCAAVKLFPINEQCYIIPFNNKGKLEATFILGYQGMITLAERAGVQMIDAQVVYDKDEFGCTLGTNPSITHNADVFSLDRGEPKGVYALAILKSGHARVFPMSMEDVYKHRAKSKSWQGKGRDYSPWNAANDPQLTMPKKTAIRQLFKFIPKDDATKAVLDLDAKSEYVRRETVVNPNQQITYDVPDDMEIAAFVQEATEYLSSQGVVGVSIDDALKEVTGGDSFTGITHKDLEAVKALVFTGEAPTTGESLELKNG